MSETGDRDVLERARAERLRHVLTIVCDALEDEGIWHTLAFGTLLGAVRDGDLIAWDHDFDLFARPADRDRIVGLSDALEPETGITIKYAYLSTEDLAVAPAGIDRFNASALVVFERDEPIGDIYTYSLFADGVLRQYDLPQEIYWCPRNSFPAWFFEGRTRARLGGETFWAPADPERWLAHVYGNDWRVPYRAVQRGGAERAGTTSLGDRESPDLHALIAACERAGWDRGVYAGVGLPAWPRVVRGAGPGRWRGDPRGIEWERLEDLARW